MTSVCALIVIAKEPVPGRVKTRLSPPFSQAAAAQLAQAAIADTLAAVLAAVRRAGARGIVARPVLALDGNAGPWLRDALEGPLLLRTVRQRAGGLDVRLAGAFDDATRVAQAGHALLIGMDTPQVTAGLLVDAMEELASPGCDAVLGHAEDGGWWALGLRRPDPSLLLGVPTSTPHTGREQEGRLLDAGLAVSRLRRLRDVDTAADAEQVAVAAPRGRFAAALERLRPVRVRCA